MSTENLNKQEAVEKLSDLVNSIDVGMLSTFSKLSDYPYTIPMSRQEVDEAGNIWFLFSSDSDTFKNLTEDSRVALSYAHVGDYKFLSIHGVGEVSQDRQRIEKYWNKFMDVWFEKGKEDPHIRILKVIPAEAHYWDNKTNKLMTLLKVATSAVTGKDLDIGREGELKL